MSVINPAKKIVRSNPLFLPIHLPRCPLFYLIRTRYHLFYELWICGITEVLIGAPITLIRLHREPLRLDTSINEGFLVEYPMPPLREFYLLTVSD